MISCIGQNTGKIIKREKPEFSIALRWCFSQKNEHYLVISDQVVPLGLCHQRLVCSPQDGKSLQPLKIEVVGLNGCLLSPALV